MKTMLYLKKTIIKLNSSVRNSSISINLDIQHIIYTSHSKEMGVHPLVEVVDLPGISKSKSEFRQFMLAP